MAINCFRSHTCITFELLSINLYELIKKNKFQGFSLQLVRKFAHSLLQCLDTLYRNKIIHCDMKPENVLLKQQGRSGIKVGVFFALITCFTGLKTNPHASALLFMPHIRSNDICNVLSLSQNKRVFVIQINSDLVYL